MSACEQVKETLPWIREHCNGWEIADAWRAEDEGLLPEGFSVGYPATGYVARRSSDGMVVIVEHLDRLGDALLRLDSWPVAPRRTSQ